MKFRRNSKEEKLFRIVAVVGLLLLVTLLIFYFITSNEDLLDLIAPLLFIPPVYFFITHSLKKVLLNLKKTKLL